MNENAIIDRFCAIEGIYCTRTITFNGPWTFFFAYPSNPRMKDFSYELVVELEERGIFGSRWEDLVRNDLIFAKVCEAIHSNDFLLAEITNPNLNVQLEVGYALAVGRQPVLLSNENYKSWKPDLLTTLEGCFYESRQDIHEYIARWQKDRPADTFEPNRRLSLLDRMGFYDNREERETAFHIKPRVSTDWIGRVDKSLKRSSFKFSTMDHSDFVYDAFFVQAREIQRASQIIASFVSTDHIEWEEHNANVALLTGFSIGLGKQVLVLQESPAAPILDLGSVSHRFESESQVQSIVDSWIENQQQLSVTQTIVSQQQALSRQQAVQLRNVYLGHPDALQDNDLLNYFVKTKECEDAIEGRRSIFIGRRGSGKSANFQKIRAEISGQPNVINVEILPDDFQLEQITSFLKGINNLPDPRLTFQSIWNYVLTTEILKSLAENTDRLFSSADDVSRNTLLNIYRSEYDKLAMDFGSRAVFALGKLIPLDHGLSEEERKSKSEEALKSLRNYHLGRLLKDFAKDEKITFFIVADDLDKHWRANTSQSINLLLGLIAEVARMQRFFEQYLKIVIFLREDIYDVLARYDDDLAKRDIMRMEWTLPNLHHLVAARLAKSSSDQTDEEIWSAIFPERVRNEDASEYLLTNSLPRPRDALNFCQKAIDQAQRNGHMHVTEQDILDGEKQYSEELFTSVSSEFRGMFPKLEEVLIEFAGVAEKTTWNSFEHFAEKIIRDKGDILTQWTDGEDMTIQTFAEVLFRIGLIGLSREEKSRVHFCNGRSFSDIWGLASPIPTIHIHRAFFECLEISVTGPRPSL